MSWVATPPPTVRLTFGVPKLICVVPNTPLYFGAIFGAEKHALIHHGFVKWRSTSKLREQPLRGIAREKTENRRTASFAFKTNIHIIINIPRYFSNLTKAQTGHKRQTKNSAISSHLNLRQKTRIFGKADHFSWS